MRSDVKVRSCYLNEIRVVEQERVESALGELLDDVVQDLGGEVGECGHWTGGFADSGYCARCV